MLFVRIKQAAKFFKYKFQVKLQQFKALEDYIRNNASDFEVVILTAMESIQNNDADISAYSDIIDYLEDNLDAKREECSDFTFSGG